MEGSSQLEIQRHVRQLSDEWVKALVRRDGETLNRIMDDKADFIGEVTSGDLKVEHLSREHVSVRVFGATAVLTALDAATWLYHGREISGQYKAIAIFTLRDNRWQMCALQACPIQTQ